MGLLPAWIQTSLRTRIHAVRLHALLQVENLIKNKTVSDANEKIIKQKKKKHFFANKTQISVYIIIIHILYTCKAIKFLNNACHTWCISVCSVCLYLPDLCLNSNPFCVFCRHCISRVCRFCVSIFRRFSVSEFRKYLDLPVMRI
jgi:hypothetical protein